MPEFDIHHFKENFELEIRSFKGSWWVRYGIVASFIVVVVVIVLAAVIQYPQHVSGAFRLYSINTAVNIPLKPGRKIDQIWVENGKEATKGQVILSYHDNARLSDIQALEGLVERAVRGDISFDQLYRGIAHRAVELGSLQEAFVELNNLLLENYLFVEYTEAEIKIRNLKDELENYRSLKEETLKLLEMDIREARLLEDQFRIDSLLFRDRAISKVEYLRRKEVFLSKAKLQQQNTLSYKRTEAELTKLANAIREMENKKEETVDKLHARIRNALGGFAVAIGRWKEEQLVIAPIDGQVNFMGHFNEKEASLSEDNSVIIVPPSTSYKALIEIPFTRAGEVKEGRRVLLKLDAFPYREYGILEGELASVSRVAGKESYQCEVSLGDLLTNQGTRITFRERMGGMAQIVTEDRSLLGILFDKIIYVFKK